MLLLLVCLFKKKGFSLRLKVLVWVHAVMMADCSKLLVRHMKVNVLQTWDACAGVRNVDCWWSADEDAKWCRLMRWRSCEDRMALVLYELDASADKTWTRFTVRRYFRVGVTWSRGPRRATRRAAAFWTLCSGAVVDLGRPANIALQ